LASRKGRITLVAQWLLAAVVIGFAVRELARQWESLAPALAGVRLEWGRILASGALVLATYLLLIEAWRSTLRAWSQSLPFATAARIWFVSNLGKYVPGRVWQIAAMGAMAQRAGVSPAAAIEIPQWWPLEFPAGGHRDFPVGCEFRSCWERAVGERAVRSEIA